MTMSVSPMGDRGGGPRQRAAPPTVSPYGTWGSPLSASDVAMAGIRLGAVAIDGEETYWTEGRPNEGGRCVLVRLGRDGVIEDVTPPGFNVRTRVHEYGGGAYAVQDGTIYFANFEDQRLYRQRRGAHPEALTPLVRAVTLENGRDSGPGLFFADIVVDARRRQLICVREDHTGDGEAVNTLVRISLDGGPSAGDIVASGHDFYSTPRLSPDGSRLAWLSWRHPQMPWDGTELWVAELTGEGGLANARQVAGGATESIYQPGWSPDGVLYFVSDRDGWWKLYRTRHLADTWSAPSDPSRPNDLSGADAGPVVVNPPEGAEFGRPEWVFGTATWVCAGATRLVVAYTHRGTWRLASVDTVTGELSEMASGLQPHEWLAATPSHLVTVAGRSTEPDAVVRIDLTTGALETIRRASAVSLPPTCVSVAEAIEFPTAHARTAHAFYYAPRNEDFASPPGERPPLIVVSHGGPTSGARSAFSLPVQFWTSRGFGVVDVNYGGSCGFGRAYRQRLNGEWGVVDVEDSINAARYLVAQGRADGARLVIRGGSAGGYTTLAALTFRPEIFRAGASYYGISDLEVLFVHDTHKFESRYTDTLIGPYPAMRATYQARSPIHSVDRLSCPLILFQGLEDKVVPPEQSEMMATALRAKGLPVVYLAFEGEQHGFRKAETIVRCLEEELAFYGSVLGLDREARHQPTPGRVRIRTSPPHPTRGDLS